MSPVRRLSEHYEPSAAASSRLEERVASTIRSLDHLGPAVQSHVVAAFARMLAEDDPSFDPVGFSAAVAEEQDHG